ncbi:MAG: phosphonate ABC transporter, permease protein PhnE [Sedimentibacter sp.]
MQFQLIRSKEHIPLKKEKNLHTWIGVFIVIFITFATGYLTEFDVKKAVLAMPGIFKFIATDFLPPDITAAPKFMSSLMDTFYMAFISTITGALISLILALLCASPTSPNRAVEFIIRAFASALRNIPSLAWTIILVPAFGIGKTVGLMALLIGAIGSMTRFFTETIEEVDLGNIEAIRSVGGSYWQVLKSGVLPQCYPGLIAWTLYNFELGIRASTIIGMVGGGGIGFFIQSTIKLFQYDQAMMAVIVVAVVVLIVEAASKKIREQIM